MSDKAIARAEERVARSRQFILANECFFATRMLGLKVEMEEGGTMSTNGTTWRWGWRFVEGCTQDKVNFVTLHERVHEALMHPTRMIALSDHATANIAADHVVNILITRIGMLARYSDAECRKLNREATIKYSSFKHPSYRMPEDGVLDFRFAGMGLEEVYDILKGEDAETGDGGDKEEDGEGKGKGKGDGDGKNERRTPCPWGAVEEAVNDETGEPLAPEEVAAVEQQILQDLAVAENLAKARGQMPGIISEAVKLAKEVSQDWEEELRDKLVDSIPVDYDFTRQDTHNAGSTLVTPGILRTGLGHLGVFADASGSMTQGEFSQAMTELFFICEEMMPERITFVQFDHNASEPEIIEQGDMPKLERRHNGGTRFSAPFDLCRKRGLIDDFDVIIVFTDGGDNTYPNIEPECPTIWATTAVFYEGNPPFGEVIGMRFNG